MNTTTNTTSTSNAQLKTLYIITLERQDDEEVEEEEVKEAQQKKANRVQVKKKTRKSPRTVANLIRKIKTKKEENLSAYVIISLPNPNREIILLYMYVKRISFAERNKN